MNCMYGCSDCVGTRHGKIRNWLSYVSDAVTNRGAQSRKNKRPEPLSLGASRERPNSGAWSSLELVVGRVP